jgi:hypothetical protein
MQGVFQRFFQAVDAFNAQKWDEVKKLLHKNVVVFNVNHLNYIIGLKEAMKYFRGLPKDSPPQFVPTSMSLEPGIYPLSVSGALWTDKRHNVDRSNTISFSNLALSSSRRFGLRTRTEARGERKKGLCCARWEGGNQDLIITRHNNLTTKGR